MVGERPVGNTMASDIVGYQDLVGADDADSIMRAISGADIVGGSGRRQQVNAASLPVSFVGVPSTAIPASSTGTTIQVPIQRAIRPDRFLISRSSITAGALVNDIKVGTISLNASVNPVPGDAFAADAMGTAIRAVVTAVPAVGIQVTISNSTAVQFTLQACFFGPSMPG